MIGKITRWIPKTRKYQPGRMTLILLVKQGENGRWRWYVYQDEQYVAGGTPSGFDTPAAAESIGKMVIGYPHDLIEVKRNPHPNPREVQPHVDSQLEPA